MFRHVSACALLVSFPALATGQEKSSESVVEVKKSVSTNGDSKDEHYRKVTRDGRVVEESGNPALSRKLDLGKLRRVQDGDRRADVKVDSDSKTSTHTRRVVVRDGETIVDEETVDGKPVRPGSRDFGDIDDLLRGMDLDVDVRDLLRDARRGGNVKRDSQSKTHTRRMVVRDGKMIVDEETVDGKPVRPGSRDFGDIDDLLRDMDLDVDVRDLLRDARRGGNVKRDSQSKAHTRRMVVRDGKTIVDEETVDGKPVRPGSRDFGDIDDLLRDLDVDVRDLLRDARRGGNVRRDSLRLRDLDDALDALRRVDDGEVERAKPIERVKPIRRIVHAGGAGRETAAIL